MNPDLRYAAHLPLSGIGEQGQRRIGAAHVLLIGIGGLGCAAAQYLVSSGIGTLTLCDFDTVTESNLSRQILYTPADLGRTKVEAASMALQKLNPRCVIHSIEKRVNEADLRSLAQPCDLVMDASDNYGTRLAVNRTCLALSTPWVMASCIRMEGQITLLRPDQPEKACYRCTYGDAPETLEDCPGAGIFAPVAGVVGTSAAYFTLAHVAGIDTPAGIHLFDAAHWNWRSVAVNKDPVCKDCGGQ